MSTTELDEVVTLLERILPDPTGYGERLLQQVVLRWAEFPGQHNTVVSGEASTGRGPSLVDLVLRPADPDDTSDHLNEEPPLDPVEDGRTENDRTENDRTENDRTEEDRADGAATPTDVQTLLASALGACDCWGLQEACLTCQGDGFPGWADPDVELFQEYVGPAASRLSALWEDEPDGDQRPRRDGNDRSRQGVNA